MGKILIDADMKAFLESPVVIIGAIQDASSRPIISRSNGARLQDDGSVIDIFISDAQWPDTIKNLKIGNPIAMTFCRASDYQTYQIKGIVEDVQPVDADDSAYAGRYADELQAVLESLGMLRGQIESIFGVEDLVRVRFRPSDVFLQTPGPGAGQRLSQVSQ